MDLIIVESPHKAKTISKYLGTNYKVVASKGHVSDLPQRRIGIDVKNNYTPEYEISPDKVDIINSIKKDIQGADKVYLAADPDREGEAISWHLSNVLNIKDEKCRIVFNEISKKAVLKALDCCREINMKLVDAQQARRVLDRLVGYELSPIISKKIKSGLSAGRVQSVALKMIVDKEREIRNFKPEEYWNIFAQICTMENLKTKFKSEFNDIDGKKTKVKNKETADKVIDGSKKGVWSVDKIKRAESISRPNPPFTTSTMQQDAISKLGMSASMVTQVAQKLYEGVEVTGEGQVALVTYIRTDSVRVSADAQNEASTYIIQNYGNDYAPKKPNFYSSKKDAQDAHEAIRPISMDKTPDALRDKIGKNEYRLYKLIFDRFVASQMTPAVYDTLNVHIVADCVNEAKYGYVLKGKTIVFKGFTAVYNNTPINDEDDEKIDKALPNFEENQSIKMIDVSGEQKFTKPPTRYTDGSFIKAMEDNGIGRPSTFEKTIATITNRNYVERENKNLFPTELGEIVCDQLVKYFPDIMDVKFTSTMESNLDKIEEGGVKWNDVIADFYPDFHKKIEEVKYDGVRIKPKEEVSDVACDKCGAMMVIKDGKFGKFLACPNFPKCRNTKPYGQSVGACPHCGKPVYKKISKKGKPYYTCSGYPDCKFLAWDVPAPYLCPDCKNTMKVVKEKDGNLKYVCTNRDCKHQEIVEKKD